METQTKTEMIGGGSALAEGRRKELVRNVEGFLRAAIERLEPEPVGARHVGRPRIIPAMCLWSGLLVCVLHGFDSQLALWRLIKFVWSMVVSAHRGERPGSVQAAGAGRDAGAGATVSLDQCAVAGAPDTP